MVILRPVGESGVVGSSGDVGIAEGRSRIPEKDSVRSQERRAVIGGSCKDPLEMNRLATPVERQSWQRKKRCFFSLSPLLF